MPIQTLALNLQLDENDTPPQWLLLIPAGQIKGRDGRQWINDQPNEVIAYNHQLARDIVFDFEHATQFKASKGEQAPASGWIKSKDLKVQDGAVWGRVDWNDAGRSALSKKEYRYYSPAFLYDNQSRVTGIHHIALTNRHNLFDLPALNIQQKERVMTLALAIRAALNLPETATEADAISAIDRIKTEKQLALNAQQTPDPKKFVPMETHQLALNRAGDAEGKLAERERNQRTLAAETLVDNAIENKQVAPANRDHYLALCQQDGGIEQVKALLDSAPKLLASDTDLDNKKPEDESVALNSEQQKVADAFGNSAEDLAKYADC